MARRPSLLVVEDDQAVREAVAMVVSYLGYEAVLAASGSGEEALEIIASLPLLDGLYTDIKLAGQVSGWNVGQAFGVLWPRKPIVYASASAPEPQTPLGQGIFLRKPFDPHMLEMVFGQVAP
jgi:CheY-like chemotaxis protein